ncbi:MAG: ribosome recycling factor [Phycisphaerae bacterium]|jgi:ribosome recycling factor|nr:ribosome recycling factor [Phycisphaerae bacterium]
MEKVDDFLKGELHTVRTGRASMGLVEHIRVDYYGTLTDLRQLAGITVPEPLMIVIKPYDPGSVAAIVKAIQTSDIGLQPQSDGKLVRIAVPPLSQERRDALVHQVKSMGEQCKISLRNIRREVIKEIDQEKKDKVFGEDDASHGHDLATNLVHQYEGKADALVKAKTDEIMEV